MLGIYALLFWLPALASAFGLAFAWTSGILRRPWVPLAWFAVALFLQFQGSAFAHAWTVGLVLQTVLAVYLLVRMRTA